MSGTQFRILHACLYLLVSLGYCVPALAQYELGTEYDHVPHPFIMPGFNLNNSGFQPASGSIDGGIMFEPRWFALNVDGGYNAARKTNDGTIDNRNGDVRSIGGEFLLRLPRHWLVGTHYLYDALYTTNYDKSLGGFSYGGGRDFCPEGYCVRLVGFYSQSGARIDEPAVHGFGGEFTEPSPTNSRSHVYFTVRSGFSVLSRGPVESGGVVGYASYGLIFRW